MPGTSPTRSELAAFLSGVRDFEAAYHNHKEMLGWLSIAVYLAGAVQVALSTLRGIPAAAAIVAATVAVVTYARRQFNLRLYASQVVWATTRLSALALAGKIEVGDNVAPEEPTPPDPPHRSAIERLGRAVFPERHSVDTTNRDVLPKLVVDEMRKRASLIREQKTGRESEARAESLERGTYFLVFVVGIATVLVVLLR
jgi:hypothetical protein